MTEINAYIEKRYNSWLDYSKYHCTKKGIEGESIDILDEVIISLLSKDESNLLRMCRTESKCGRFMELDIFVLRMIRLNIYSPTSPYQSKYKPIPRANKDLMRLNIADVEQDQADRAEMILERFKLVRIILDELSLSKKARKIFDHKFTNGLSFHEWTGTEDMKELYTTYKKVENLIKAKIAGKTIF